MSFKLHDGKKIFRGMKDLIGAPAKRGPKLLRPRASRACQYCRSRKVRCDWAMTANPCTNCRLDDRACIALPRKRTVVRSGKSASKRTSRTKQTGTSIALPTPSPSISVGSEPSHSPLAYECLLPEGIEQEMDEISPNCSGASFPLSPLGETPRSLDWSFPRSRESYSTGDPISPALVSQGIVSFDSTNSHSYSYLAAQNSSFQSTLPPYIRPLPQSVTSEDTDYLSKKGALEVPERTLRNALLRKYVDYVHPFLPILDLEDFLQPIQTGSPSSSLSLLLFQSVMFAAVPFIDTSVLDAAGLDRKQTQTHYYERARLLYEFDTEPDNLVLVQALLLMCHWNESPNYVKDSWHWLNLSISTARRVGLHLNPQTLTFDTKTTALRKRIWWSCYMRDRLIALSMRRPLLIQDDDCNVPSLELQDFETTVLSPRVLRLLGAGSSVGDASRRTQLAVMCIEKVKLCRCISHVLLGQYSVQSRPVSGGRTEATVTLVPKKCASKVSEVMKCGQQLHDWYKQLPEEARYRSKIRKGAKGQSVALVHLATLFMIYFASSSALYRPHVLPSPPFQSFRELSSLSKQKVHEAACEITRTAQDLMDLDLACYLPSTSVTALLPAAFNHLFGSRSVDASARETSSLKFSHCVQILQTIGDRHAIAKQAALFLVSVMRSASIPGLAKDSQTRSLVHQSRMEVDGVDETAFTFPDSRRFSFMQTRYSSSASCSSEELQHCPALTLSTTSHSDDEVFSEMDEFPSTSMDERSRRGKEADTEVNFDSWIDLDGEGVKGAWGSISISDQYVE